ncbi:MAG: MBL fold metallo-hydrolase [Candidatus Thorarchaeota archaeon]
MKIERVEKRGVLFTFEKPITANVYVIMGDEFVFILDTYCGPTSMERVKQFLREEGQDDKQVIVFNSHADWDHIWGNCTFKSSIIIAHEKSRDRIQNEGEEILAKYAHYKTGEVVLVPANLSFEKRIIFEGEGVEFYYSPGHTVDSASCYDSKDRVLFVGDNIETPIPYVNNLEFETYIATLDEYLTRDSRAVIAGHDPVQRDDKLIRENRQYLVHFSNWDIDMEKMEELHRSQHLNNLSIIAEMVAGSVVKKTALEHYKLAEVFLSNLEQKDAVKIALANVRKVTE